MYIKEPPTDGKVSVAVQYSNSSMHVYDYVHADCTAIADHEHACYKSVWYVFVSVTVSSFHNYFRG